MRICRQRSWGELSPLLSSCQPSRLLVGGHRRFPFPVPEKMSSLRVVPSQGEGAEQSGEESPGRRLGKTIYWAFDTWIWASPGWLMALSFRFGSLQRWYDRQHGWPSRADQTAVNQVDGVAYPQLSKLIITGLSRDHLYNIIGFKACWVPIYGSALTSSLLCQLLIKNEE